MLLWCINPAFWVGAVTSLPSVHRVVETLFSQWFGVCIATDFCLSFGRKVAYFLFPEWEEIFFNSILSA